jgi:hypothetical protein
MERIDRAVLAAFIVAVMVTCGVVGVVVAGSRDTGPVAANPTGEPECAVDRGVLPEWARTGFSEREPEIAHVVGVRGELAAVLFGDPPTAPPSRDRSNKILWVARRTPEPGPLCLTAVRGGRRVTRVVESGPGPSFVDLPEGCWRISARWTGGEDELELRYRER